MSQANLFILIPENNPKFHWINNLDILINEKNVVSYLENLKSLKETVQFENYNGYYDSESYTNLFKHFEIIEDCFPNPIKRRLHSLFSDFFDWRKNTAQLNQNNYTIFNQGIENHTLCEVTQRQNNDSGNPFALLNHQAISTANSSIEITINERTTESIEVLSNIEEMTQWFSENRIPKRNFQPIPKHNIPNPIHRKGELISPLYGSPENATAILKKAIGINSRELFGYDESNEMVIVFKFENNTPQNQYHGYHVTQDSEEIPKEIKNKLFNN
ncbi:hypothetical protein FNW52_05110 [Flavobacterium sp. ZT3R18]|uniref:hypothetical protein n=1 Tax=Flavobacterium sp. ZT3R18 TaxID=2594429 RepID=UPI00117B1ED8|nr:hypothetical protein [Flavobacterium sp. ZT3R18]TRX37344.1 hypothetical protein FNW52_05110 [Flavobacterium sp. ZT3R18]